MYKLTNSKIISVASEVLTRYENYIQRLSDSNAASGNDLTPP